MKERMADGGKTTEGAGRWPQAAATYAETIIVEEVRHS